ncbi:MAG: HD domain-containing phosphohydrolase [Gemmatimonadota bacterium]
MSPTAERADSAGSLPPQVGELVRRARLEQRAGSHAEARVLYHDALRLLTRREEASTAASLFRWIGDTHRDEGATEAAQDAYTVCRAVSELNDDRLNLAYVLNSLGILEWQWGRLDEANDLYEQSQTIATEIGETRLTAMVAQNTGVLANIRGDLIGALRHYRDSLAGYRRLGDISRMAGVMSNIGMLHTDLQQWEEAEQMFAESAALCEQVDDSRSRTMVEVNRTELFILMGDTERAQESCDAALELASRLDHHLALGEVHKNFGVIARHRGDFQLAEAKLVDARDIAERYANPLLAAEVNRELAQLYRQADRNSDALQALNAAHAIFGDLRAQTDVADIHLRIAELEATFLDVVRQWGESIESKDRYTAGHCQRVAEFSCLLAEDLGFDPQTLTWFRMGALLHDVGKTTIPAEILNKAGALSEEEWALMRRHPAAGEDLLSTIEFPWDIRPMVRSHHERWDGSGYPDGLVGEQIPLAARVLCVADVFDALTTTRSYRPAYSPHAALEIMNGDAGRIFDPDHLRRFRKLVLERLERGLIQPGG